MFIAHSREIYTLHQVDVWWYSFFAVRLLKRERVLERTFPYTYLVVMITALPFGCTLTGDELFRDLVYLKMKQNLHWVSWTIFLHFCCCWFGQVHFRSRTLLMDSNNLLFLVWCISCILYFCATVWYSTLHCMHAHTFYLAQWKDKQTVNASRDRRIASIVMQSEEQHQNRIKFKSWAKKLWTYYK